VGWLKVKALSSSPRIAKTNTKHLKKLLGRSTFEYIKTVMQKHTTFLWVSIFSTGGCNLPVYKYFHSSFNENIL
jgi:hypothetical protein